MPAPDLESYKVVAGELSSATKFNNFVQALEDEFGDIDPDQIPGYPALVTRFLRGDGSWAGAMTSFTPTLTQSGSVAITGNASSYLQIGQIVICLVAFAVNAAGTTNNNIVVGALPVTAAATRMFGIGI